MVMKFRWTPFFYVLLLLLTLIFSSILNPDLHVSARARWNADCEIKLGAWQAAAQIPFPHIEGATAAVNGKIYIFGGFKDTSLNVSNRVDVYNVAANKWETANTQKRPMPQAISHIQGAVDGKWVWIAGGFVGQNPGDATSKVWKYDTVEDLWYAGPSLPKARAGGAFAIVGRKLHYAGGLINRDDSSGDHWILDLDNPGAGWKDAAPVPVKRNHGSAAGINGVFYFIGGQFKHDHDPIDQKFVHAFGGNGWTQKANLALGRSHFEPGTLVIEDRIVIVGGRANQNKQFTMKQISTYNPAKNAWKELTPLPVPLIAPNAAYVNGKLIVTAGGTKYNVGQKKTWISQVSFTTCDLPPTATQTPIPPTATPTMTPTNTPAAPLTLISPNMSQQVSKSDHVFVWTPQSGAFGYIVEIIGVTTPYRFRQGFSDPTTICAAEICSTQLDFSLAPLPNNARLEWRVIARTASGDFYSAKQMFFTQMQ
jgi:N-acetylneuraminic acid mutarotase